MFSLKVPSILLLILLGVSARAGQETMKIDNKGEISDRAGGGANAIVCRNSKKKIIRAELLDLFEGRHLRGLTYTAKPEDTVQTRLQTAIKKFKSIVFPESIDSSFFSTPWYYFEDKNAFKVPSVNEYWTQFQDRFKFLDDLAKLGPVNDSYEIIEPNEKGCKKERLAYYDDNLKMIFLAKKIWDKLNPLNKAATIFHEASYHYERKFRNSTNSQVPRKIVASAFADQSIPTLDNGVKDRKIVCQPYLSDGTTDFIYSQDEKGNHFLNFGSFLGTRVYSETSIVLKLNENGTYNKSFETIRSDIELPAIDIQISKMNPKTFQKSRKINLLIFSGPEQKQISLTDENGIFPCYLPTKNPLEVSEPLRINLYEQLCPKGNPDSALHCN